MALRWIFTADTSPFRKGLNQMRTETKAFSRSVTRSMGAIFGSAAILAGFQRWIRNMDDLAKRAQKLGASVESLQRVEFVGEKAGVDARNLTNLLVRLERRFGEAARGSAEYAKSLKNLGIDRISASRPEEAILALSEAWKKAEGSGTEYADLLKVLDSEARELIPLLREGPEALAEGMKKASVVSSHTTKRIERLNDTFVDMKNKVSVALSFIFDGLSAIAKTVGEWLAFITSSWIKVFEQIKTQLQNVGRGIAAAFDKDLQGVVDSAKAMRRDVVDVAGDIKRNMTDTAKSIGEIWSEVFGKAAEDVKKVGDAVGALDGQIFGGSPFEPAIVEHNKAQEQIAAAKRANFDAAVASPGPFELVTRPKTRTEFLKDRPIELAEEAESTTGKAPSIPVSSLRSIGGDVAGSGLTGKDQGLVIRRLSLAELQTHTQELRGIKAALGGGTKPVAEPRG